MSWGKEALGDLFSIGSSKRVLKSQWQTSGVPFYRGREVTKLATNGTVDNELFISEKLYAEFEKQFGVPKAGDIVITAIGTIGNAYVVHAHDRFYFKDASVLWLSKKRGIESGFVNYWLQSPLFKRQLDKSNGATVDTLTIQKLKSVQIDLPPLPEQKRIVAILDEAFAGIATAVANTEKNLANARELFESYLTAVFSQRGDEWSSHRIGDIFQTATGITPSKTNPDYYGNDIPFVKPPELVGAPLHSASDGLSYKGAAQARVLPEWSVLVSCIGNLGKVGFNSVPVAFNQQINAILPNENRALPEFVYYQVLSRPFNEQLEALASGTTVPIVNKSKFNSIQLVLPTEMTQKAVVEKAREIQKQTQDLGKIIQRKAESLLELKLSLLQKAFSGELTTAPQDEIEIALA